MNSLGLQTPPDVPIPYNMHTERFLAESTAVFGPPSAPPRLLQDPLSDTQLTVGKAIIEEVIRLRTPGLFFRKVVAPKGVEFSTGEHVPCTCVVSIVCTTLTCVSIVFSNAQKPIHTPYPCPTGGDFIAFSARHLHTHPRLYPTDPEAFDIDRYLVRDEKRKHAGALGLQWGGGRHPCVGQRFATGEILLLLHTLFSHWRVERVVMEGGSTPPQQAGKGAPTSYWERAETPPVSKSQLGTTDKPTRPVFVRCVPIETIEG